MRICPWQTRGVKGLVALGATLVLALTGCSAGTQGLSDSSAGDDSSSSGKSPSTSSDAGGQESSALGACSEEDGCLSTGFTVASDGFSFANWQGEGNLDVDSMITLFGRSDVCAEEPGEECELLPAAQQWLTQANSSLSSGRCEGFAVLSQSLYDGVYALSKLDGTAQVTADLRRENIDVLRALDTVWATQLIPEVQQAAASTRSLSPRSIAQIVAEAVANGERVTIGMYGEDGTGHTVTPVEVTQYDSTVTISIYDNNYPGAPQSITISGDEWTYAPVDVLGNELAPATSGGTGSLDVVSDSDRVLPAPSGFSSADSAARASAQMLVTSGGGGELDVQIAVDGKTRSVTDLIAGAVDGVIMTPVRASLTSVVGFSIIWEPLAVDEIAVQVVTSGAGDEAMVSVDVPGSPRVLVTGLAGESTETAGNVSVSGDGEIAIESSASRPTSISVADGSTLTETQADPSSAVVISDDDASESPVIARSSDDEAVAPADSGETEDDAATSNEQGKRASSGNENSNAGGNAGGNGAGASSGNENGNAGGNGAGASSGNENGNAGGNGAGASSGNENGNAGGNGAGASSGNENGNAGGNGAGASSGNENGNAGGNGAGASSGNENSNAGGNGAGASNGNENSNAGGNGNGASNGNENSNAGGNGNGRGRSASADTSGGESVEPSDGGSNPADTPNDGSGQAGNSGKVPPGQQKRKS